MWLFQGGMSKPPCALLSGSLYFLLKYDFLCTEGKILSPLGRYSFAGLEEEEKIS